MNGVKCLMSMGRSYRIDRMVFGALFTGVALASHWGKVSYLVGSHSGFFSATGIIAPLTGSFFDLQHGMMILFLAAVGKGSMFAFGGSLLLGLAQWVPGAIAALYLRTQSYLYGLIVPIVCMGLFLVHPVGMHAWGYSLLWVVPLVVHHYRSYRFCRLLTSTFIAHAVGSVLWIYGRPMVPAVWWGLIPVALCERVVMALGMVLAYHLFSYAKSRLSIWYARLHNIALAM